MIVVIIENDGSVSTVDMKKEEIKESLNIFTAVLKTDYGIIKYADFDKEKLIWKTPQDKTGDKIDDKINDEL